MSSVRPLAIGLLLSAVASWRPACITYLFERTAALGLQSVLERAPFAPSSGDGRLTWCGNYLDHAFTRGAVVRPGARVLRDVMSSDHVPLSFEIAIADAEGCEGR